MRLKSGNDYTKILPYMGVSVLLLGLNWLGWLSGFRQLGERAFNPISGVVRSMGRSIYQPWEAFRFALSGPQHVADLESRFAEALVKAEQVDELKAENISLRTLLGSGAEVENSYLPIKVLSMSGEMVLDKGKVQGVNVGDTMVDENHMLVGRVMRVSDWTAWALTIADPQVKVQITIGNKQIAGIMTGTGSKGVVDVEQSDEVRVGEMVKTSGINGEYVPGILVGRVVEVEPESANIYKKIWIDLMGKPTNWIYLVKGKVDKP